MLIKTTGDIFDSKCHVLVNTCNCYGAMGRGIALAMKLKYPAMYQAYRKLCKNTGNGTLRPGRVWPYKINDNRVIWNYMVKDHWRDAARMEWIERCLRVTAEQYQQRNVRSIAMPYIGANNGWLPWEPIEALIVKYMDPLPIRVELVSFKK